MPHPGALEQAVGRLHRTGQKSETINVYLFTPLQTVAVKLRNDMVKKEQTANTAVRDAKVLLGGLMGDGPLPDLHAGRLAGRSKVTLGAA